MTIILGGTALLGIMMAVAAARCPLGRAIGLAFDSQIDGPRGRLGSLD